MTGGLFSLDGRNALVVGGSRGIGAAATTALRTCIAFGRAMLERGSGSVINVLSIGAAGLPRLAAYSASKSGAMTMGLMADQHPASGIVARTPMGRFGDPSDVAGAAVDLASDASRLVSGSTQFVDGGWTAQ